MLNKIVVMGRLTRDPELRRTQNGTAVTSFSVACDRDFRSQSGEKETDFIDVVAWRTTAEFVNKRRAAEIVADSVYFGDSKPADAQAGGKQTSAASYGGAAELPEDFDPFSEVDASDGELPF